MVCAETNKKFDVMSTALENEDRDFVTEDDLRAGNELVWVKNNNRLTVRVARAEAGRPTIVLAIPNWPDLLALDNGILYLNVKTFLCAYTQLLLRLIGNHIVIVMGTFEPQLFRLFLLLLAYRDSAFLA